MTKRKRKLLAVDGIERRLEQEIEANGNFINNETSRIRDNIYDLYKKAVWIDSQLNGSCIVDPFFGFHFYEEEDAMAFKLKWE